MDAKIASMEKGRPILDTSWTPAKEHELIKLMRKACKRKTNHYRRPRTPYG